MRKQNRKRGLIQKISCYQWIALLMCFFIITGCGKSENNTNNDSIKDENPEVILEKAFDEFDSYAGYVLKHTSKTIDPMLAMNVNEEITVQGIRKDGQHYQWLNGTGTEDGNNYLINRVFKASKDGFKFFELINNGDVFTLLDYHTIEYSENESGNNYRDCFNLFYKNNYKDYFDIKKEQIDGKTNITLYCKDLKGYTEAFYGKVDPEYNTLLDYPNATYNQIEYIYTLDENDHLVKFEYRYVFEYEKELISKTEVMETIQKKDVTFDTNKIDTIMENAQNGVIKEGDEVDWIK